MKEYAEKFYTGKAWKKCRAAYIAHRVSVDGGMCERCHKELGYIVHHKNYITPDNISDPSVPLSFDNIEYVCHNCHNKEHFKIDDSEREIIFNEDGDVIGISPPNL